MPKEKVEITNNRKTTKPSNGTIQKSKLSSRSKIDDVKKTREPSIERNNLRKNITENKTNNKKIESISSKSTAAKSISSKTSLTKTVSKSSTNSNDAASTSSRSITNKTATKPIKALKTINSPTITNTSSSRNTIVPSKGTKISARDVTSKRVTKEQFFPKKYPYSSYLHENEDKTKPTEDTKRKIESKVKIKTNPEAAKPKLSRERTMTRTLSPSEVKVAKDIVEHNKPTITNIRPRTATIRKHNQDERENETEIETDTELVSSNTTVDADVMESEKESSNEYEDDFESYESDFEVYSSSSSSSADSLSIDTDGNNSDTSTDSERMTEFTQKRTNSAGTDDERKLDSGNYDLHDVKHKQILDNINEAIEKENSNLNISMNKNEAIYSLASLSDEGFEDGSKHLLVNNGFVNFTDAKKKQQKKKINLKCRKRGEDLMNMIRLNSVYFSLFDMEAISYEHFMQSYGKTGTIQISSQTGDDDLDEDVQTDHIQMIDKYTQFPIRFSKEDDDDYFGECLKHDRLQTNNNATRNLNKFLEKSGKLMLHILEQKETKIQVQIKQNYSDIPFSDGYLLINFEKTQFLRNRNVNFMTYSKDNQLLTIHEGGIEIYMNENEQLLARPTICVWDIYELSYPQFMLVSSGEITRACFDSIHGNLIFGGISDGSITVWDLREASTLHRAIYDEPTDENHVMRTATYTTTPTIDFERSNEKIIAVKSFHMDVAQNNNELNQSQNTSGIQICTLTESGYIIIWSVIEKQATPELLSDDHGLVLWGSVILVQGLVISLQKFNTNLIELQCFDFEIHPNDINHLFVASNYGVLHCLVSGMKPKPKLYITGNSTTYCIEMAPFSPTYFLSGCENGNIKLHSRFYEKPLMTLRTVEQNNKHDAKIVMIQWSNIRPCVFFVKDDKNNIHIWDLMSSDMFPIHTIPFNENISDIKLSPLLKSNEPIYMAIANKEYGIRLHKMSKEFCALTPEQYKTELNTFLNYANRL